MKENAIIKCIISSIGLFFWLLLSPLFLSSNVVIYFSGITIFLMLFYFQSLLGNKLLINRLSQKKIDCMKYVVLLGVFLWMVGSYLYEYETDNFQVKNYSRHLVPVYVYFLLILIITFFSVQLIYSCDISKILSKLIRIGLSCIVMYLQGVFLYNPNIFSGSEADMNLLHIDAYTTSIINSSNGVPYSDTMNSIYGRYGILYVIPVKVVNFFVHNKWIAVTICVALVGAITYGLVCFLLNVLIKNDFIFFISLLASCVPSFQMIGHHSYEVYYQGFPHRILPQLVTLLCCYFSIKHKEKRSVRLISWIMMSLCILWSLEMGVIGLIVWVICDFYLEYGVSGWKLINVLKEILGVFCSLTGAYIILLSYNIVCGEKSTPIRVFLFPFIKNSSLDYVDSKSAFQSLTDSLYTRKYEGALEGGFIFLIIFLSVIGIGLVKYFGKKLTDNELLLFLISVLGIECYFYHVSHDNFFTNYIFIATGIFIPAMLVDKLVEKQEDRDINRSKYVVVLYTMTMVLTVLCIASLSSLPSKYSRVKSSIWVTEEADRFMSEMCFSIPEDTLCIGEGMPQICAYAGYNPKIEISDFPDFPIEASMRVEEIIKSNEYDHILISEFNKQFITDDYELVKEYTYIYNPVYSYLYYERKV